MLINSFSTTMKTPVPQKYKANGHDFSSSKLNGLNKDTITFSAAKTSLSPLERVQLNKDLDNIENQSIKYFINNRLPSGLVLDRASNSEKASLKKNANKICSIAATGYGLTALILAKEKNLISKEQAKNYTMQTLKFVDENTPEIQGGWLAHFMDGKSGKNFGNSEISSVDTALFFFNAFASAEYFGGDVKKQVKKMYDKINFKMMLTQDNEKPDQKAFNLGFHVKDGKREFIPYKWDEYSEGILVPLLALGSKDIPEDVWTKGWNREKKWEYNDNKTFLHLPLFTYFYPHGLLDLKDKVDKNGDNFWNSSKNAVKMQMAYCKDSGYPDGLFGITACDCDNDEYRADQPCDGANDGTIAPPAIIACLPFAEKEVSQRLTTLKKLGLTNNDKYGPCNAYNVKSGWRASDALGIDLGSMLLMTDAYKTGLIHKLINKNEIVQNSMKRAGFHKTNSSS